MTGLNTAAFAVIAAMGIYLYLLDRKFAPHACRCGRKRDGRHAK